MSKNPSPSVKLRNRTQTANNYIILSDTESDKENLENLQLKGTARLKTLSKKVKRKKDLVTTDSDDEPKKLSKKSKKTPFGETTENGHFSDPSDHEFPGNEPLIEDENFKIESKLTEEQYLEILNLFNNGTMDEFLALSNTPQKRLEFLFTLRPFEDYKDLQTRLYEHQYKLFLQSIEGIVYARGIVSIIFQRCIKISEKMEQKVSSLINMNDETTSRNQMEIKYQPQSLNKNMSLKPYQLIGLNWLCLLHKEGINGILADEMGLGKTCQAIAFLSHLIEKKRTSFHLIVVPSSTLDNWVREITTWNPNFYFTVYQGTPEERLYMRKNILNNKFERPLNAILTTYNYVLISKDDKAFFRRLKYDYCVFDEAHMLKNMESLRYIGLDQLNSKRRLLLTGTPIQNNFLELMSLLFFVMPDMFRKNKSHFNKIFSLKQSQWEKDAFYNQKVSQAKGIIQPFILRRLKTEVLKQLPKKNENLIYCEMTERQNKDYSEKKLYLKEKQNECLKITSSKSTVDNKAEFDLAAYKERKKTLKHNHVFYVFMELRKIANHPLLNRSLYTDDKIKEMARIIMQQSSPGTVYEFVVEDMTLMNDFELHMMCPFYTGLEKYKLTDKHILDSGKFQMLDKIFEEKKRIGDRCLLFSQFTIMLDIVEVYLKIRKITFIRLDGQTPVKNRQGLIDKFNNDNKIFVFLLTTKAGGVGINLTAANTVIIHDLDYNPFNDKQAEDRSHRIGQTKDVQVYTLLSKDSIDETMLKIQKFKLELGDDINGTNDSKTKSVMADLLKEALNLD